MSIQFGSGLTIITTSWATFKSMCSSKGLIVQYDDNGLTYSVFGFDGPLVYQCTIYKGDVPNGDDQSANDSNKTDFETNYKPTANKPLEPRTSDHRVRISSEKTNTSRTTIYSHDWTDPTTWCQGAVRVVDEIATDSGDHKTYILAHQNIIDVVHGKITSEDYLKNADGYSYTVQVKVNDVVKTVQNPHYRDGYDDGYGLDGYSTALGDGQDKDYFVQHINGKITFINALNADDVIKVTYFYATSSVFTIKPSAGKTLRLDLAEVQFSSDVIMTDSVVFQPYGFVEVFAPQYCPTPYPAGTLIPLGNPLIYKHMNDFQNDATRAYPVYAPLGGSGWRGSPQSTVIFDWDYVSSTVLEASKGMEIRISLQHNKKFEGYYATATFYCIIENG